MSAAVEISFEINGRPERRTVEPRRLLSDFIRHDLQLTGTHVGCEQGACGACTVLLDGAAVRSCLLFAPQVDGSRLTTVEGLGAGGTLTPLQESFRRHHALQCGFCTAGFLMTLTEYFSRLQAEPRADPQPDSKADLREVLSGNLCRCTGYANIVAAVEEHRASLLNGASG